MINRHPHTLVINYEPELDTTAVDGIEGRNIDGTITKKLRGRMEFSGSSQNSYKAIFYTGKTDLKLFENDNLSATFNGKQFGIVEVQPLQTHTEIWLT